MAGSEPFVVAVVPTLNRPVELAQLLASLARTPRFLRAVIVVDNGAAEATRRVAESCAIPTVYWACDSNLGCGGGLHRAEELALQHFGRELTHLWIMDDDGEVVPETLGLLLESMERTGAVVSHPLTVDREDRVRWFPGLLHEAKFRAVKAAPTPEEYLAACGSEPVPFSWALGIALLVSREGLERVGFHRTDFWVRGEDLEYSLRLTYHALGIFVPEARVRHLPPTKPDEDAEEYVRHAALLQNVAYIAFCLPHGRRIAGTLLGNYWRFLQTWGWRPRVLFGAARLFFWGAIMGWPAGRTHGAQQAGKGAASAP